MKAICRFECTLWMVLIFVGSGLSALALEGTSDTRGLGEMPKNSRQGAQVVTRNTHQFVANEGQWVNDAVRFALRRPGADILILEDCPCIQLVLSGVSGERRAVRAHFVGANAVPPVGADRCVAWFNYFSGAKHRWRTGVPSFEAVAYRDLYDGIDLIIKGGSDHVKLEFHLKPGADWRDIVVAYDGIGPIALDEMGRLVVTTPVGEVVDEAPVMYQELDGGRVEVEGRFRLVGGNAYGFDVTSVPSLDHPLIIDPQMAWSTFIGGTSLENANDVAMDRAGNVYITGYTTSGDFPTTGGAHDTSYNGSGDVFVSKFSGGGQLLWSTYMGGSGQDVARGVTAHASGAVHVTGSTTSSNFPVTAGAYDTTHNGAKDVFIARLGSTGALQRATYLGASSDDEGFDIASDETGNICVAGVTRSSSFPTTAGAYDRTLGGSKDAFVSKFSSGGALLWSTYLGGSSSDEGYGIAIAGTTPICVTGRTNSSDFPGGGGAYSGGVDAFVSKFNSAGGLQWCAYLGGTDWDVGFGVAVNGSGEVAVTGETYSDNFPTVNAYDPTPDGYPDYKDCFVSRFAADGGLSWSTYLGGNGDDVGNHVAADGAGNVYVTGVTECADFPTLEGYDTSHNGYYDAFASKFGPEGGLVWSTYIGGASDDLGKGVAADEGGNVCVAGYTLSGNFPTTAGAYDRSHNGGWDAFVLILGEPGGFRIADAIGRTVAEVDDSGNLTLAGTLTQNSTPAGTAESDFLVKRGDGTIVAAIDSSGNLVLLGSLHQNQSPMVPPVGSFIIKSGTGNVVAYISPSGHLYLAGGVTAGP